MITKGGKAPAFAAEDQNGNNVNLNDFAGKTLVLYFYPKDDTPGCTAEACDLRDNHMALLNKGFAVVGVSRDPVKSHRKFADKFSLPFPLLADVDGAICEAYGVWGKKKFMGREYMGINRTTFIISPDGSIMEVIDKVDTKEPTKQVLNILGQ
jgi:peroxiredoxin Q/BCP